MSNPDVKFSFGDNWADFVKHHFSEKRVENTKTWLLRFLGLETLDGLSFLDVGSGSGLHSLAAHRAGARSITSFDLDPASVACTQRLRHMAGDPPSWQVFQGSILDESTVAKLGPADIVYSWGVLHHTGRMWDAVERACALVRPGGSLYIALYGTDSNSDYWTGVKIKYNRKSKIGKRLMEMRYVYRDLVRPNLRRPGKLVARIRSDRNHPRGMSYMTDVRDWLGGYPYEHARAEEVLAFGRQRGFTLTNLHTGEACIEYLFVKSRAG